MSTGAPAVGIYRLTREWSTFAWLCARHLAARVAERWAAERTGDVHGFGCDDCETERQGGPGMPRFFVLTGGDDPGDLIDRAAQHGTPARAAAHRSAQPGGVYGAVEIRRNA